MIGRGGRTVTNGSARQIPMPIDELRDLIDDVERRRRTIAVYAPEDPGVVDQFATRNVTVEQRALPAGGPPGFVVIREDGEFVGSIGVDGLAKLLSPPLVRPWDEELVSEGYRALFETLEETLFASFDRRQLLLTAREIEERAWRVGRGTLRVGFQSLSAMRSQVPVYERLAGAADLDVHVYGNDDWAPPELPGVTVHAEDDDEIGAFWLLAFDGGGDVRQTCALLAEERSRNRFYGFWTYDPGRVGELLTYLERAYG